MASRPPLNALHIFCVVVSEGGFRPAAQVLHLTPGAVSRQIQSLEVRLNQELFEREIGNSASLTQAGKQLYKKVSAHLSAILEALNVGSRSRRHMSILVDTSVTLAMHWLIPALPIFRQRHPQLHVHIRTIDGAINPSSPTDLFIRRDIVELRGLPSHEFMVERSVLVSSSTLDIKATQRRSKNLRWLSKVPRIGTRSRPDLWPCWSKVHGLDSKLSEPSLEFDNTVLAIQAALQGAGVLVVPEVFVGEMLYSGALKLLSTTRIDTGTYSFAVGRQRDSARVTLFTDWLKERGDSISLNST